MSKKKIDFLHQDNYLDEEVAPVIMTENNNKLVEENKKLKLENEKFKAEIEKLKGEKETLIEAASKAEEENSNKDPIINSVQRDYIAGEVCRDITNRFLLPEEIKKAHEEGTIHFHDTDYFPQNMKNCCLINLDDMLQNGTVISETLIEKPKSFSTACNIATQIIAQVASNQYGGQSISLTHLAPFVQVSRDKIRKEVMEELESVHHELGSSFDTLLEDIVERRVKAEIKKGVQTIQYQVITLLTTNG